MFNLFKTKTVDSGKVKVFCDWFIDNNKLIIESVENSANNQEKMMSYLNEVERQLALIYADGYKKDIQFEYGFNTEENKWELNLFHLNNKFLIAATNEIAEILNDKLKETWLVNTDC